MTTDNRTNEPTEPTEAQVEAAAKAIWERSAKIDDPFWDGGALDYGIKQIYRADARAALVAAQGAAPAVSGSTSDGFHTFDELYEYRMLYNAHAAHGWLAAGIPVVKSWKHSDGELCFGGGWFIVTATLPAGQVSNHYKAEHWGLFKVPEVELPPAYDGHTPHDAAMRLRIEAEHASRGRANTAEACIAEAAKLHRPREGDDLSEAQCVGCLEVDPGGWVPWPCPTAVALGLNEGENE